jgi:hypothetical protein
MHRSSSNLVLVHRFFERVLLLELKKEYSVAVHSFCKGCMHLNGYIIGLHRSSSNLVVVRFFLLAVRALFRANTYCDSGPQFMQSHIRRTGTHVPQWDSNQELKDHQIFAPPHYYIKLKLWLYAGPVVALTTHQDCVGFLV